MKHDFDEILINLDSVNCRRFIYTENPIDGGGGDSEGRHGLRRELGLGGGLEVPPVARYPTTSQGGVAILCPHRQPLGGCLGEHPISLGDRAIGVDDPMPLGSLGTLLEGNSPLAVGLGEVQQEGSSEATDHTGLGDQESSHTLGVTHEGGEAGGGDQLDHGSRGGGWWRSVPLA